jgi:hypothetical protein
MAQQEHVHIISAGENIHTAYAAAFRILPTISRTHVLADSSIYEISKKPEEEKARLAVRNAVLAAKEISASLSIPFSRELVFPPVYPFVRDTLAKISRGSPGARFTFDLSGGSKPLCMALFAVSVWLDGEVYSTFDEKAARNVPLPGRPARTMLENPNYQTILALLLRGGKKGGKTISPEWVSRQYIFSQLFSLYVPTRTKRKKPEGSPSVHPAAFKQGRTPAGLTHGTLSDFIGALVEAGLVMQETSTDTNRQKIYRITESGEIAFRLFADPGAGTLVRTVLGNG